MTYDADPVSVDPPFRKQGMGSYFPSEALASAPSLEIDTLLGFIFGHNAPSLVLLRNFGFARWGELPRVAVLDGIERDLVIVGRRVQRRPVHCPPERPDLAYRHARPYTRRPDAGGPEPFNRTNRKSTGEEANPSCCGSFVRCLPERSWQS